MLAVKLLVFVVLMALAAANKWRYGPALAAGNSGAVGRFRILATVEWMLIAAVLVVTAALTTFYSPGQGV